MNSDTNPAELKLCVNCKYIGTNVSRDSSTYKCFSPQNSHTINLVTGDREYKVEHCGTHRTIDNNQYCTPAGNWYEKRETPAVSESVALGTNTAITKPGIRKIAVSSNLLKDLGI